VVIYTQPLLFVLDSEISWQHELSYELDLRFSWSSEMRYWYHSDKWYNIKAQNSIVLVYMYRPAISRITDGIKYKTSGDRKSSLSQTYYVGIIFTVCQDSVLWHKSALSYRLGGRWKEQYLFLMIPCNKLFLWVCFSKFVCLSVCPLICLQTMILQALIIWYHVTENLPLWHILNFPY